MKKRKIYFALFITAAILTLTYLGGCDKSFTSEPESRIDEVSLAVGGPRYKSVSAFKKYGELHNSFLMDVKNNFLIENSFKGKEYKINTLVRFQQKTVDNTLFNDADKNILKQKIEDYKKYYYQEDLLKDFKENIIDKMRKKDWLSKSSLLLPAYEQEAINNLCQTAYDASSGLISVDQFQSAVNEMAASYDQYYSETSLSEDAGTLLGICLAITQSSIDWWQQNPDADIYAQLEKSSKILLAPWIAADAIGALGAGITSYLTQRARTGGQVSWTAVGGSALAGAVAGSTGVVGKVFKWLGGLF